MKKFFKSVFVALAIVSSGAVVTGCDEDSPLLKGNWGEILGEVLKIVLEITNPASNDTFAGTATLSMYAYNSADNTYNMDSEQKVTPIVEISVLTEDGQEDENGKLQYGYIQFTIPTAITVGDVTVSDLVFTTYYDDQSGKISPDADTYLTGGTCTYNGKTKATINAACFEGTLSETTLNLTNIYFQVGDKVFMGSFSGTAETDEQ